MKTRHTRLFASVSAAALIGITALTPMATAQGVVDPVAENTTNSNTPEGVNDALDPWNLNYYTQQVIDQLNSIGYDGPLNDVDDILAAVENIRNDANGGQGEMVNFLNLLAEYIQKPSYNPPAGPVYNEQGQLRDRYTFYYGDNGDNVSPEERYGWEDGTVIELDEDGNITDDRYTAGENGAYIDSANNDSPVNKNGTPIQRENADGSGNWVTVDTEGVQFDRVTGEWVTDDVVTEYTDDYAAFDSTPRFLDSLNGDTIVGESGLPVDGVWNVPSGQVVNPPSTDDEDDPVVEDEDDTDVEDETTPDTEQGEVTFPDGDWADDLVPTYDGSDVYTDSAIFDKDDVKFYKRVVDEDGVVTWLLVDRSGNPIEAKDDEVTDPKPGDDETSDEASDNPLDGLNVTVEDGQIKVSFPVDLAGNPHTLTASLDARNGFTVTLTPGNESSKGGGSPNNGSSNGSSVISDPEVTSVYIDANGNTYPARYDEDGNLVPPKNLADDTYRLGFEIQGEDGDPVIVGTDYNVKVGDGAMTEAKNDEGGGVVNVDNKTDKDDDKDKGKNGGSSNNSSSANFKPAVTSLESLGVGGGGTDVGGGGTDSDATTMQNSDDSTSNRTSRNASNDSNAANVASPAGGPATASTYDNGVQTHASGQENLAVTGTNTNTLMAMVGGLLLAAAGVLLVGRRKGWV